MTVAESTLVTIDNSKDKNVKQEPRNDSTQPGHP